MTIFDDFGNVFNTIGQSIGSAFDGSTHGFLSGNWDDLSLGLKRVAGLPTEIITNNFKTVARGFGEGSGDFLSQLSYNPSFYVIAGAGILVLLIGGYVVYKAGKYIYFSVVFFWILSKIMQVK